MRQKGKGHFVGCERIQQLRLLRRHFVQIAIHTAGATNAATYTSYYFAEIYQ